MFVVHLNDGKILKEEEGITWDNVPNGIDLFEYLTPSNETITLPKCDSYFFSNEAKSYLVIDQDLSLRTPFSITASILGGIIGDKAIYVRVGRTGKIQIEMKDKKDLPFIPSTYKQGS